jgi:hypothetical protein
MEWIWKKKIYKILIIFYNYYKFNFSEVKLISFPIPYPNRLLPNSDIFLDLYSKNKIDL